MFLGTTIEHSIKHPIICDGTETNRTDRIRQNMTRKTIITPTQLREKFQQSTENARWILQKSLKKRHDRTQLDGEKQTRILIFLGIGPEALLKDTCEVRNRTGQNRIRRKE